MRLTLVLGLLGLSLLPHAVSAASSLRGQMAQIARSAHGPVGAAAQIVEAPGAAVSLNGSRRFPMQSVYKLPIGMAVLHQVDSGTLTLNQRIQIAPRDFAAPSRHSPLRDHNPHGANRTVAELLAAMMIESDGTASDVLLKRVGGPASVTKYLRGLSIHNMVVATSESAMAASEQVQYQNWATPDAVVALLCALQSGQGLSPASRHRLLGLMTATSTGPHQIKGLLPAGTVVAHKTGGSGTVNGLTRATNDAGLVTLPDGRHLAVVVFVADTRADAATRDRVIAQIARAAWDSCSKF